MTFTTDNNYLKSISVLDWIEQFAAYLKKVEFLLIGRRRTTMRSNPFDAAQLNPSLD